MLSRVFGSARRKAVFFGVFVVLWLLPLKPGPLWTAVTAAVTLGVATAVSYILMFVWDEATRLVSEKAG